MSGSESESVQPVKSGDQLKYHSETWYLAKPSQLDGRHLERRRYREQRITTRNMVRLANGWQQRLDCPPRHLQQAIIAVPAIAVYQSHGDRQPQCAERTRRNVRRRARL